MKLIRNLNKKFSNNRVITIGNFDGIHIGHKEIIKKVIKESVKFKYISSLITFSPYPEEFFKKKFKGRLIMFKEKFIYLKKLGINELIVINFKKDISHLSPKYFLKYILVKKLKMKVIIIGKNFRFGYKKSGNVKMIKSFSKKYNFKLIENNLLNCNKNKNISSSLIRNLLIKGKIKEANNILGYNYFISGYVSHGRKIGRLLEFPTINIIVNQRIINFEGVFIVKVFINFNSYKKNYLGVSCIGKKPMFNDKKNILEVFLLDLSKNLYYKYVKVFFLKKIRNQKKFKNLKDLKYSIFKDIILAKKYFRKISNNEK